MVRQSFLFAAIACCVVVIDQITKYYVVLKQPEWQFGFLKIQLIQNTGAGFGILQGKTTILALLSLIVVVVIVVYYHKIPADLMAQTLFALFLGGTIGNLLDRVFRHYVIDFINPGFWPAFNVADATLTIAAAGLVVYYWRNDHSE